MHTQEQLDLLVKCENKIQTRIISIQTRMCIIVTILRTTDPNHISNQI